MVKGIGAIAETESRALVRADEAPQVSRDLLDRLAVGDETGVGTALARYATASKAMIVRTAFVELATRREGESASDALHRAGRTAERLVDTLPDADGRALMTELDPHVIGAMLMASAGDALSTTIERVDPGRIEDLLAGDLDLWTVPAEPANAGGPFDTRSDADLLDQGDGGGERVAGIDAERLVRVLWTIFQCADPRARRFLRRLSHDLVAYPLALALRGEVEGERVPARIPPGSDVPPEAIAVLQARERAYEPPEEREEGLLVGAREGDVPDPAALDCSDAELVQLLGRIAELSPMTYRKIVRRARELDLDDVRDRLMDSARERAEGGETTMTTGTGDDLFAPLDDPESPKPGSSAA